MGSRIWTVSNGLSFIRLLLVIPVVRLLLDSGSDHRITIVAIIFAAVVTDLLDGFLARKLNEVTDFGKVIDPLADKVSVGAVAVVLAIQDKLPLWFVASVLARDILILLCSLYLGVSRKIVLPSNSTGKWAVSALGLLLFIVILRLPALAGIEMFLMILGIVMLLVSTFQYGQRFLNTLSARE